MRNKLTADNIEITGWLERKEVLEHLLDSDVFILTSLWEGLPIALLESMYMKKICIVSNVIGNREVIQSGINGYVCDSIDDFCEAIKYSKKGECSHLSYKAYIDIINKYNTNVMSEKYKKIYTKYNLD